MMVLVDLAAIFWRNYHGAKKSGPEAYLLTLDLVRELMRSDDTIVICCEGKNLLRFGYYPEYKANREAKPADAVESLAEIIAELSTWPISVVAVDGYEADDVIFTLARHSTDRVLILSSDKDLYHCVSERVTLRTAVGAVVGPAECFAKFGVRPDQIPDWLALVGDVADNIPGCPNCGPGRAALLLQRFDTLAAVMAAPAREIEKIRGIGKTTLFSLREWDPSLPRRLTQLLEIPELVSAIKSPEKGTDTMADMSKIVTARKSGPLKILAYGPEGVGKTRFAAFSSKPIFLCAEKGLNAPDLLDVPTFPAPDNWDDCMAAIAWARDAEHDHRTLVIDSLDWLYRMLKADICEKQNMTVQTFEDYGRGEKYAIDYWATFMAAIAELQEKRGMHVVALAHSSTKLFNSPTSDDFMRYQLALADKASELWKQWPDFLLFMSQEIFSKKAKNDRTNKGVIGDHQIYTSKTAAFDAKCRIRLPEAIPYETENPWRAFNAAVREAAAPKAKPELAVAPAQDTKTVAA